MAIAANVKALCQSSQYSDEVEIRECLYRPKPMSSKLANCLSLRWQTERRNPERNRKSTLWVGKVLPRFSACAAMFVRTISSTHCQAGCLPEMSDSAGMENVRVIVCTAWSASGHTHTHTLCVLSSCLRLINLHFLLAVAVVNFLASFSHLLNFRAIF